VALTLRGEVDLGGIVRPQEDPRWKDGMLMGHWLAEEGRGPESQENWVCQSGR